MASKDSTQAKRDIADAAYDAVKTIAQAAEAAAKVVSAATAEALKISTAKEDKGNGDHDLIVSLGVKMEDLKSDIKELKDGTSHRIEMVEKDKLNVADSYPVMYKAGVEMRLSDYENRIRELEKGMTKIVTWGSAAIVAIGILEFILSRFYGK